MRIDAALKNGSEQLKLTSTSARLDTEILLAHCLNKQRSYLYTWPEKTLSADQHHAFNQAIAKRQDLYPIAYITGFQEFWSLKLKVTPDVLIPRADTELLVEAALEKISTIDNPKVLELGTGSGAISLALGVERSDCNITATDISDAALAIANENRQVHKLNNLSLVKSNWFENIPTEKFDLVISNPPYIDPNDAHLREGIRHEPLLALTSEGNGLDDLKHISNLAKNYLTPGGWLILEHGYDQGKTVSDILKKAAYQQISCLSDLGGNERINLGMNAT